MCKVIMNIQERESVDYSAMNPWDRIFCDVNDICDTCARYGEDCDGRVIEGEDYD